YIRNLYSCCFFFSSRRRHTRWPRDWSSDVCSSDLLSKRYGATANRFRDKLVELLGDSRGNAVKTAEAFEVCEYGTQPTREQLLQIGRASCRERGEVSGGGGALKGKRE